MAFLQKKDNAKSAVADNPLSIGATTINVTTSDGSKFPSAGDFIVTIWDEQTYPDPADDSNMEKVRCTARTGDAITCEATSNEHAQGETVAILVVEDLFNESLDQDVKKTDSVEFADVTVGSVVIDDTEITVPDDFNIELSTGLQLSWANDFSDNVTTRDALKVSGGDLVIGNQGATNDTYKLIFHWTSIPSVAELFWEMYAHADTAPNLYVDFITSGSTTTSVMRLSAFSPWYFNLGSTSLYFRYDASNYLSLQIANDGAAIFNAVGTDPEFFFADQVTFQDNVYIAHSGNSYLYISSTNDEAGITIQSDSGSSGDTWTIREDTGSTDLNIYSDGDGGVVFDNRVGIGSSPGNSWLTISGSSATIKEGITVQHTFTGSLGPSNSFLNTINAFASGSYTGNHDFTFLRLQGYLTGNDDGYDHYCVGGVFRTGTVIIGSTMTGQHLFVGGMFEVGITFYGGTLSGDLYMIGGYFREGTGGGSGNEYRMAGMFEGDVGIYSDKKLYFESSVNTSARTFATGDTYIVYDSGGSTLDFFVDGAEIFSLGASEMIVKKDLYFEGDGTGIPYGSMYTNTTIAVTISESSTPTEVKDATNDGFTAGELNLITFPTEGDEHYLVVTKAGRYKVEWSISISQNSPSSAIVCEQGIMINGSAVNPGRSLRAIANSTDVGASSGVAILDLAANDQISLYLDNQTNTTNIDVERANLVVTMIGGT